jgi:hypothetical protein
LSIRKEKKQQNNNILELDFFEKNIHSTQKRFGPQQGQTWLSSKNQIFLSTLDLKLSHQDLNVTNQLSKQYVAIVNRSYHHN